MNTFLSRLNTIFAFTLTVLAALTFLCFLSTVFLSYSVKVSLKSNNAEVKNVQDFSVSTTRNDLGVLSFDLKADFTPLFNWNTKQLFVYLTAQYETKQNKFNQVVLWDKIVLRSDKKLHLSYNNMNTKYYFFDDGHGLRGLKNVSLHMSWNVIPTAGLLPLVSEHGQKHLFNFPVSYTPYQR
ncbi:signal peptidase complex subunit 3-like [Exaiptasia diaphana]|uniref:Signal peptidase complex subunit 3 n=1 Tax=Exaiptasia diaphana TaxID=2652724 RepID=A0A913XU24_EXADI|nr:signal peptidase complex subunit 3-like [Exaiptasia diaphana]